MWIKLFCFVGKEHSKVDRALALELCLNGEFEDLKSQQDREGEWKDYCAPIEKCWDVFLYMLHDASR